MTTTTRARMLLGIDTLPAPVREVRAGPVRAFLDGSDLRLARVGGTEIVRRIYVGVRDPNWNTIPPVVTALELEAVADHFAARFRVRHTARDLDFVWDGEITGNADGTIRYAMDGVAASDFWCANVGICVHHPVRGTAGQPFAATTPDGSLEGVLPELIGPQIKRDGLSLPLFPAFSDLTIGPAAGAVHFAFDGALFEMEDHRNWTDASFKTYSKEPALGRPALMAAGQSIKQSVTVSMPFLASEPVLLSAMPSAAADLRVRLGEPLGRQVPLLGLGTASHGGALTERELQLVRRLRLRHIRVDLYPRGAQELDNAGAAFRTCAQVGCPVELALFLRDTAADLDRARDFLATCGAQVGRVLVFADDAPVTPAGLLEQARARLEEALPGAQFAGGSRVYFTELNRLRPDIPPRAGAVYSINPQVHATDESSLVENLEAQADTLRAARAIYPTQELIVSPVTLRPRFNASAQRAKPEPDPAELPAPVDPRQCSLFGAAWTLGSVKQLAEAGAGAVTYYETTGWRGVMERATGSPLPLRFPSRPGMVFPLYHVLRDIGERREAGVVGCSSSDPLRAQGLALYDEQGWRILLGNLSLAPQEIALDALPEAREARLRVLDEETFEQATLDPDGFRSGYRTVRIRGGWLVVSLGAYGVACVDLPR